MNKKELFVLDTDMLIYYLDYLERYLNENENSKYLVSKHVLEELKVLCFSKQSEDLEFVFEFFKQYEKTDRVEILKEENFTQNNIFYCNEKLTVFNILSEAKKHDAIFLTNDSLKASLAFKADINFICIENLIYQEKNQYKEFEYQIKFKRKYENLNLFYEAYFTPYVIVDLSFLMKNPYLFLSIIEHERSIGISIQTIIGIMLLIKHEDDNAIMVLNILKMGINKRKVYVIFNKKLPSEFNEKFLNSNSNLDLNCIVAAYERKSIYVTSDFSLYSLAKSQNVMTIYLKDELKLWEFDECIHAYKKSKLTKEEEESSFNYIELLKK